MTTTSPANRYGAIAAEIYDLDKPYWKLPDTAFYLGALKNISGPVLEPACGSGRTLIPLAEAGHDMWGFDPSAEMLAQAADRCRAAGITAELSQQDFETFAFDVRFAAIILPVASFTLIADADAAHRVLARFHEALLPGGLIIIDMTTLAALADTRDDRRQFTAPNGDLLTLEGKRIDTDWVSQTSRHLLRYERWRANRLVETELEPMEMRQWGVDVFRMALERAGFTGITPHANYRRDTPPAPGTRMVTWKALRPSPVSRPVRHRPAIARPR